MKKFILLLGLSATVIPHPLAWAGGPVVQRSADNVSVFVGIYGHGPLAAPFDIHQDVFGGVNWENDVSFVGAPGGVPGGPPGDVVTLNFVRLEHVIAPHGEARGPDLGPNTASIAAVPPGPQPVGDAKVLQADHGNHHDQAVLLLFGISNGNRIPVYSAIVAAQHIVPAGFFVLHYGLFKPETRSADFTGGVIFAVDGETRMATVAAAVVGKEEVKSLRVMTGSAEKPGVKLVELSGEAFDRTAGPVVSAIAQVKLAPAQVAALQEAGAVVVLTTASGTFTAMLDSRGLDARERPDSPFCRATAPVRVRANSQGPSRDACSRELAMLAAFDAASDGLCAGAGCTGDCRVAESTCKPQIVLLPDPDDFTCWRTPLEGCGERQGWRCFWRAPQWFTCECACR